MMKKSLIILYKTPFGHYYYETNPNEVVVKICINI